MSDFDFDLFVIGAGSGGVRAARIAAGGMSVDDGALIGTALLLVKGRAGSEPPPPGAKASETPAKPDLRQKFRNRIGTVQQDKRAIEEVLRGLHDEGSGR